MMAQVILSIDDSIFLSMKREKEDFAKDLLFYAALSLYRKNKLSLGKAAELAGYKRLDFIDRLRFEGEPIFHYDESYLTEMYSNISEFEKKIIK